MNNVQINPSQLSTISIANSGSQLSTSYIKPITVDRILQLEKEVACLLEEIIKIRTKNDAYQK